MGALPLGDVFAIAEDRDGYLWLGTGQRAGQIRRRRVHAPRELGVSRGRPRDRYRYSSARATAHSGSVTEAQAVLRG